MPNYLTPEGAKKLASELNQLLNVDRVKVVQEVAEAAAQDIRGGRVRLRQVGRQATGAGGP